MELKSGNLPLQGKACMKTAKVLIDPDKTSSPQKEKVSEIVAVLVNSPDTFVFQSNRYVPRKGRNFITTKEDLKAFLRVNFVVTFN